MDTPIATLELTALDCPDPLELARFYSRITGWPVAEQKIDDWVELDPTPAGRPARPTLAFQRISEGRYQAPEWPGQEHPQRMHFDFRVPDLDAGEAAILEVGARKHEVQPSPDDFRVYLDPVGHPFCLVRE